MSRSSSGPGRAPLKRATAGSTPPRDAIDCTTPLPADLAPSLRNLVAVVQLHPGAPRRPRRGIAASRLRTESTWFDSTRGHCEDGATAARRAHNPLPYGRSGSIPDLATPTSPGGAARFISASVGVRFPSSVLHSGLV